MEKGNFGTFLQSFFCILSFIIVVHYIHYMHGRRHLQALRCLRGYIICHEKEHTIMRRSVRSTKNIALTTKMGNPQLILGILFY